MHLRLVAERPQIGLKPRNQEFCVLPSVLAAKLRRFCSVKPNISKGFGANKRQIMPC